MRLTVDISQIENLAHRLDTLDAVAFGEGAVRVVNTLADDTYEMARPRMIERINLTDAYVRERMRVDHATSPNSVVASIVASGSNPDITMLSKYAPVQRSQPAKTKRGKGAFRNGRNIVPGEKAAGISVEVIRGARKPITNAFYMPLRRGRESGGNGFGVFTRNSNAPGDYRVRYGPSVYQLFRHVVADIIDQVGDDLETRIADEAERLLTKALS